MTTSSYEQNCPIAYGLDLIGDRWTLLILRDLSFAPQRFTDLRTSLVGIPPNVLSQRLKRLVADGIVAIEELPPPAARNVYALTERGRDIVPVLQSLVRFGLPAMPPGAPDATMRRGPVVATMFLSWFDLAEATLADTDEHYDVVIDGKTSHLSARHGRAVRDPDGAAAVTVSGPGWAMIRWRQGVALADLVAAGELEVTGSKAAQDRFRRLYALP